MVRCLPSTYRVRGIVIVEGDSGTPFLNVLDAAYSASRRATVDSPRQVCANRAASSDWQLI